MVFYILNILIQNSFCSGLAKTRVLLKKKTRVFLGVLWAFLGFIGLFWVLLGFFGFY